MFKRRVMFGLSTCCALRREDLLHMPAWATKFYDSRRDGLESVDMSIAGRLLWMVLDDAAGGQACLHDLEFKFRNLDESNRVPPNSYKL